MSPHLLSRTKLFNGFQEYYRCRPESGNPAFGIYLPPQVLKGYPAPVLYFLPDAGSRSINLAEQSSIQRFAAQWNIIVVFPDTAPHFQDNEGDSTEDFIVRILSDLIESYFPATGQRSIMGFGTGGYAALRAALKHPDRYAAVSSFSPVFPQNHDAAANFQTVTCPLPVLIDQGSKDCAATEAFAGTARAQGCSVQYKKRPGYGHDCFFIASFIDSHVDFHADALGL